MEHQDYNTIIFNPVTVAKKNNDNKEIQKKISQLQPNPETSKMQADKKLGQMISQGRLAKGFNKQNDFVNELNSKCKLNISLQIYSKWESNKEIPTNEQIAKIEKLIGVKLPRNKKIINNE